MYNTAKEIDWENDALYSSCCSSRIKMHVKGIEYYICTNTGTGGIFK